MKALWKKWQKLGHVDAMPLVRGKVDDGRDLANSGDYITISVSALALEHKDPVSGRIELERPDASAPTVRFWNRLEGTLRRDGDEGSTLH